MNSLPFDSKIIQAKVHLDEKLFQPPLTMGRPDVGKAGFENIVLTEIGFRYKEKRATDEICLRIGVKRKLPINKIQSETLIEDQFEGIATQVIEISPPILEPFTPDSKCYSSVRGGIEICNLNSSSLGTLGAIVRDSNSRDFILSNNHVIARIDSGRKGELILQPAIGTSHVPKSHPSKNCGNDDSCVAELYDFEPVMKSPCYMDAAIAKILKKGRSTGSDIVEMGRVKGVTDAQLEMKVKKRGRTTHLTYGRIKGLGVTIPTSYGEKVIQMTNVIRIEPTNKAFEPIKGVFSAPGDSGSLVVDSDNNAVSLHYAGSIDEVDGVKSSYSNPIRPILDRFKIYLV